MTPPLMVDRETDKLISQGSHALDMPKKDLVAEAVRSYLQKHSEDMPAGTRDALQALDGSLKSEVMALTGLSAEDIDAADGIDD